MWKLQKNKKGFTLIEATVSLVILMIGLVAIGQFFPMALRIIGDSQNLTMASNIALSKLEEIVSQDYDSVNVGIIETKGKITADASDYLYKFERQAVVENVDSNLLSSGTDIGLKKITVTVYWGSSIIREEKTLQVDALMSSF